MEREISTLTGPVRTVFKKETNLPFLVSERMKFTRMLSCLNLSLQEQKVLKKKIRTHLLSKVKRKNLVKDMKTFAQVFDCHAYRSILELSEKEQSYASFPVRNESSKEDDRGGNDRVKKESDREDREEEEKKSEFAIIESLKEENTSFLTADFDFKGKENYLLVASILEIRLCLLTAFEHANQFLIAYSGSDILTKCCTLKENSKLSANSKLDKEFYLAFYDRNNSFSVYVPLIVYGNEDTINYFLSQQLVTKDLSTDSQRKTLVAAALACGNRVELFKKYFIDQKSLMHQKSFSLSECRYILKYALFFGNINIINTVYEKITKELGSIAYIGSEYIRIGQGGHIEVAEQSLQRILKDPLFSSKDEKRFLEQVCHGSLRSLNTDMFSQLVDRYDNSILLAALTTFSCADGFNLDVFERFVLRSKEREKEATEFKLLDFDEVPLFIHDRLRIMRGFISLCIKLGLNKELIKILENNETVFKEFRSFRTVFIKECVDHTNWSLLEYIVKTTVDNIENLFTCEHLVSLLKHKNVMRWDVIRRIFSFYNEEQVVRAAGGMFFRLRTFSDKLRIYHRYHREIVKYCQANIHRQSRLDIFLQKREVFEEKHKECEEFDYGYDYCECYYDNHGRYDDKYDRYDDEYDRYELSYEYEYYSYD